MNMNKETFRQHLELGTTCVRANTMRFCFNVIPEKSLYMIYLHQSFDGNPRHNDERLFPDHDTPQIDNNVKYTADDVVGRLWRDGYIPEWIDITPLEVDSAACTYELRCCGRFTANDDILYHRQEGYPPFHCFGPILPPGWDDLEKDGTFDLHHYRDRQKK